MGVDLTQGTYGHSQGPQAETPDPCIVAGDQQGIAQGILKMQPGNADELRESQGEFLPLVVLGEPGQIEADALEHLPGQPAGAAGVVFPGGSTA